MEQMRSLTDPRHADLLEAARGKSDGSGFASSILVEKGGAGLRLPRAAGHCVGVEAVRASWKQLRNSRVTTLWPSPLLVFHS